MPALPNPQDSIHRLTKPAHPHRVQALGTNMVLSPPSRRRLLLLPRVIRPGRRQLSTSKQQPQPRHAVVAGGGVGGLALAYFLRRVGWGVTVLERRGEDEADLAAGMGLGIWVNALRCLDAAGLPLPQTLAAANRPYSWMLDSGYTSVDGRVLAKPGTELRPGQLLFCRRGHLLAALTHAALQAGAELRYGEALANYTIDDSDGMVRASTTSKGEKLPPAHVLVGAEGMDPSSSSSVVRRKLLGGRDDDGRPASRGYVVYRGVAATEAGQALAPEFSFQTWGPGRRFASVPLADGQVWFATLPLNDDADDPNPAGRKARLAGDFGSWHDPIPRLIEQTAPEGILRDRAVAHRVFPPFGAGNERAGPPVTLVGDSAHGVDPILAQGAGVAVEDAYHLACALGGLGRGEGVVGALRAYEAATRGRAELLALVSDLSQALGQLHSPGLLALRDAAFRLAPQAVKGPFFDFFIRLSLARTAGEALNAGQYGYTPPPLPVPPKP